MGSEEQFECEESSRLKEVRKLSEAVVEDAKKCEGLSEGDLSQKILSRAITRTERVNDLLRECWRENHDSSLELTHVLSSHGIRVDVSYEDGILSVLTPMMTARSGTNAAEAVSSALLAYEYEKGIDLAAEAPHRFALIETRWVRKVTRNVMDNCNEDGAVINAIMRTIIRTDNVKCLVFFGVRTLEAPEGKRIGTEFQLIPADKFRTIAWI
ncbi:MAG: hypothetical protein ACI4WR_05770 [Bulleidia sp.]